MSGQYHPTGESYPAGGKIYEGLEVRDNADHSIPQPVNTMDQKEFVGPYVTEQLLANQSQGYEAATADHGRRIAGGERGPRLVTLGIVVALISALVVVAALGGALGSELAKANAAKGASTATTTVLYTTTGTSSLAAATTTGGLLLNYTVAVPSDVFSLPYGCPGVNGQTYETIGGQTYSMSCTTSQHGGDIGNIVAYAYADCIEACSDVNVRAGSNTACTSLIFYSLLSNITATGTQRFGNCFLKNGSATTVSYVDDTLSASLLS